MLSNEQKLNAIKLWQNDISIHPLTCGSDSNHAPMVGYIDSGLNDVFIKCSDCGYTQVVPPVVYQAAEQKGFHEADICFVGGCNTKLTRDNSSIWFIGQDSQHSGYLTRICNKCREKIESGQKIPMSMGCALKE